MIRNLVDFALNNRFLVLAGRHSAVRLGRHLFHNLPVEAYPDVANNYVQVITQWPGRAAEEVEQQVTIPLEIVMNGIPHLEHLRSTSLFGLSSLMLIFDDESENDWNRQKVLERLSQVTLPAGSAAADRHGLQPGRTDLLVHAEEHESAVRPDGAEVARGLGAREAVQVRAERGGCGQLRRHHARVSGARRSGQAGRLRARASARWNSSSPTTTSTPAAASSKRDCSRSTCARSAWSDNVARHRRDGDQDAERHADSGQRYRQRDAGAEDPAGPDRQGDSSRRRQDHRQRRRGGRHRAAAQGRGIRRHARGASTRR